MRKAKKPLSSSGACGMNSRYQRSTSADALQRPEHRPGVEVLDRVQPEEERGDDAEVAAAAAQRPEEIGVLRLAGGDEAAVGEHDVGLEQIVDGQPELAREVAQPAAEGDAADAGGGDDAARRGQPEGVGGVVQIAQRRAALDAGGAGLGIDADPVHRREVDDQPVVDRCPGRGRCGRRRGWRRAGRCSRAKLTAAMTSATSAQRAISAGRLSIIAL